MFYFNNIAFIAVKKYMSEIQIPLSCQNNYLLTVIASCSMEKENFAISASKANFNKVINLFIQHEHNSEKKSDKYVSASKSAKAFEDSLRSYDPASYIKK